jgi:hypothetical protein
MELDAFSLPMLPPLQDLAPDASSILPPDAFSLPPSELEIKSFLLPPSPSPTIELDVFSLPMLLPPLDLCLDVSFILLLNAFSLLSSELEIESFLLPPSPSLTCGLDVFYLPMLSPPPNVVLGELFIPLVSLLSDVKMDSFSLPPLPSSTHELDVLNFPPMSVSLPPAADLFSLLPPSPSPSCALGVDPFSLTPPGPLPSFFFDPFSIPPYTNYVSPSFSSDIFGTLATTVRHPEDNEIPHPSPLPSVRFDPFSIPPYTNYSSPTTSSGVFGTLATTVQDPDDDEILSHPNLSPLADPSMDPVIGTPCILSYG